MISSFGGGAAVTTDDSDDHSKESDDPPPSLTYRPTTRHDTGTWLQRTVNWLRSLGDLRITKALQMKSSRKRALLNKGQRSTSAKQQASLAKSKSTSKDQTSLINEGLRIQQDLSLVSCSPYGDSSVVVRAIIDTGSPINVISREVAGRLKINPNHGDASNRQLVGCGGVDFKSLGTTRARFCLHNSRSADDKIEARDMTKFVEADFEISSRKNEPFEVIIGMETIKEETLLQLGPGLLLPILPAPVKINKKSAKTNKQIESKAREENRRLKSLVQQNLQQKQAPANKASPPALYGTKG